MGGDLDAETGGTCGESVFRYETEVAVVGEDCVSLDSWGKTADKDEGAVMVSNAARTVDKFRDCVFL